MSELKVYVKPIKTNMFGKMIVGQSYYLKSEADKVITDLTDKLQKESALLKETREWLIESQKMHKRCADNAVKVIRHQKYKRCLDKAKACHEKSERMYCEASTAKSLNEIIGNEPKDSVVEKFELLGAIASTHRKRWLELAEKFKDSEH